MVESYLSVMAMFKNEDHAMEEWLTHHFNQGVDRFFLLNNMSDGAWWDAFKQYNGDPRIHVIDWDLVKPNYSLQMGGYYHTFTDIITKYTNCKYLLVIDLDEFVYARNGYKTIKQFCKRKLDYMEFSSIRIPWKSFGSNGHIQQPPSIKEHFTMRMDYDKYHWEQGKCLHRVDKIHGVDVHASRIPLAPIYDATLDPGPHSANFDGITEGYLDRCHLVANHYTMQSEEFWTNVKMTRGDAATIDGTWNGRNMDLFNHRNSYYNDRYDNEINELT